MPAMAGSGSLQTDTQRYATSIVQITLALGWKADNDATSTPVNEITKGTVTDFIEARREEGRATSTILNDVTAWSNVMGYASQKDWIQENPNRTIERRKLIGNRRSSIIPRTDPEVAELIAEVSEWSPDVARLILWLRQTGMRLAEAPNLRATDIHPCGTRATPRVGGKVKSRRRRRPYDAIHQSLPCSLAAFGNADQRQIIREVAIRQRSCLDAVRSVPATEAGTRKPCCRSSGSGSGRLQILSAA